jgi:hypothetical protein
MDNTWFEVSPSEICWLSAAGFILLSGFALLRAWTQRRPFGAVVGLHANIFLFHGLGLATYLAAPGVDSPEVRLRVMSAIPSVSGPLLVGYAIATYFGSSRHGRTGLPGRSAFLNPIRIEWLVVLTVLSMLGYWGSRFELANSGAGTIFPVLKTLQYPCLLLATATARLDGWSFAVWLVCAGFSLITGWFTGWRSELVLLVTSIALGAVLRWPKRISLIATAGIVSMLFVLPLANLKKANYEEVSQDPLAAIESVLGIPILERLSFFTEFWAIRVNAEREIGFMQAAVDGGILELQQGKTFTDGLLQMIPRAVWTSKPIYNSFYGYTVPRVIGLVHSDDTGTSNAVNVYAEFIFNFRPFHLIWGVPLIFWLAGKMDGHATKLRNATVRDAYLLSLFFLLLQVTSIVNTTTYLLWATVLAKLADPIGGADARSFHRREGRRWPTQQRDLFVGSNRVAR